MELYNVPRNSLIRVVDKDRKVPVAAPEINQNQILRFKKIDGMYSLCFTMEGEPVHLAAWTEVEIVEESELC